MKVSALRHPILATMIAALNAMPLPIFASDAGTSPDAFDASTVLRPPAPVVVEALALDLGRIVGTQTQFVRLEATAYQRKVAEARARAFMAAHRRAEAAAAAPKKTSKTSKPAKPTEPEKPGEPAKKTTKKTEMKPEPVVVVAKPKKLPRYIAVDTVKDERSSPKAKKVVMIWDTQAEEIVGNNIYDVQSPPPVGTTAKFETYSAEYIGTGL